MGLREVDEVTITRVVIEEAAAELADFADCDIIVAGAGPAGLTAAIHMAQAGLRTIVFEKRLSFGGGIGGGGMQFHKIVVQNPAGDLLKELGCPFKEVERGVYVVDTAALIAKLASKAIDAGVKIVLGIQVVDLVYRVNPERIIGAVVQWSSVDIAQLHVDPLSFRAKATVDATGHGAEVIKMALKKIPDIKTGIITVPGEGAMWATLGEKRVVEKTGKVCPGLYATGVAVAELHSTPRMGPIFGGMLLSGRKVAQLIIDDIKLLG